MKNCKIKRVLVPYASIREFTALQMLELNGLFMFTGFVSIPNIQNGLTFSKFNPELHYIQGRVQYIRLTPQQFLKHYLK